MYLKLKELKNGTVNETNDDRCGGVFFAIAILCLILGGFAISEKDKFEKELESRDAITKELNKNSGWDNTVNNPKLETLQSSISGSFIAAGVTDSIAVDLAIAGRSTKQGEDRLKS